MCTRFWKYLLMVKGIAITFMIAGYISGKEDIVIPMERFSGLIPNLKVSLSPKTASWQESINETGDFRIETGKLVSLYQGTCERCMGSPVNKNSHMVVSFERDRGFEETCNHPDTNGSTCMRIRKTDVFVLFTRGPPKGLFRSHSWNTILFDKSYNGKRKVPNIRSLFRDHTIHIISRSLHMTFSKKRRHLTYHHRL